MRVGPPAASVAAVVLLATACAQAPATPIREEARRNVAAISGDVSGLKYADTSRLGARGSGEGAQLGAQQGASLLPGAGGLLGLAVLGLGAIVGSVKGASEAQRADVVDQTRVFLRTAIEETDFTELLLAMGLRSFSMHPSQIPSVKQRVLRADSQRLAAALPKVLESDDPQATADRELAAARSGAPSMAVH